MKTVTHLSLLLLSLTTLSLGIDSDSYIARYAVPDRKIYTIQAGSFPDSSVEAAVKLYECLKETGVPVYLRRAEISERGEWIRVRVGVLDSLAQAEAFKAKYDTLLPPDALIVQDVLLVRKNDNDAVITTPSAIWIKRDVQYTDCFNYIDLVTHPTIKNKYRDDFTQPFFSTDKREIIFEFDRKIYIINIRSFTTKIIDINKNRPQNYGGLGNSIPQLSPSGKFIGFIDANLWESRSNLWLYDVRKDSTFRLVEYVNEHVVKNFRWHPNRDIIFYVYGYGYGTVSVGGDIYATDMKGNHVKLIEHDKSKHQEITIDISIKNGYLHYQIARFNERYSKIESIIDEKVSLKKLVPLFEKKIKEKTF